MLAQIRSEQLFPLGLPQILLHYHLWYDRMSVGGHPHFQLLRLGIYRILRLGRLQSCGFDVLQELPCHLLYNSLILMNKVVAIYLQIVQEVFVSEDLSVDVHVPNGVGAGSALTHPQLFGPLHQCGL